MAGLSAEEQQGAVARYQRVRLFEMLIVLVILAGGTVLLLILQNPSLVIAGLGGVELAIAAGAVLLCGAILHFVNWRCPHCRSGLQRGVGGLIGCKKCGLVLNGKQMRKGGLTVAESALAKEMKIYDAVTVKRLFQGLVVFVGGLAFFLWATPKDTVPVPFGAPGWLNGLRILGLVIVLAGVWVFSIVGRRMTSGEQRHDAWARKKLGMAPKGAPAKQQPAPGRPSLQEEPHDLTTRIEPG